MKFIATHISSSAFLLKMRFSVASYIQKVYCLLTVTSTETALTSTVTHWVGIPCAVITPWTLSSWQHPLFLHFLREVLVGGAIGRNLAFHEQLHWPQLRFPKPLRRLRRLDPRRSPLCSSLAVTLQCFCQVQLPKPSSERANIIQTNARRNSQTIELSVTVSSLCCCKALRTNGEYVYTYCRFCRLWTSLLWHPRCGRRYILRRFKDRCTKISHA